MSSDSTNRVHFNINKNVTSATDEPVFLNLGCGKDIRKGFINIDLFVDEPDVVRMDVRKLDFADNSVDFILASDILEHFSHRETDAILREWYRVLKPNANIIIRCPSLRLQTKAYTEKKWNADIASYMIFGGQTNPGDFHCIAFDEDSIKYHLTKAGFVVADFKEEDTSQDKGFINLNMVVKAHKAAVAGLQQDYTKSTQAIVATSDITSDSKNIDTLAPMAEGKYLNIVWEGPQFVYSSLALINREHCKNIVTSDIANLTIIPSESDAYNSENFSEFVALHNNDIRYKPAPSKEVAELPYVWIRHQWPPKDEIPQGAKWIIMQPWEYSKLPAEFVDIFNKADEIWTPSNFSRTAFIDSGLDSDKVQIIPNGIDPALFKPFGPVYQLKTQKKFKFLFVGGTIYRKGFDILFRCYLSAFTSKDDVCLVVKDIGNNTFYRGQTLENDIMQAKKVANAPEIEYITEDLNETELASLYRACDVFVATYRGEGFSLPTLEAMASGLSVIVTKGGATDDFTTEESAWYINSKQVPVPRSKDMSLPAGTCLLEPDLQEIIITLQYVARQSTANFSMGMIGAYIARKHWTWQRATMKVLARLDFLYNTNMARNSSIALQDIDDDYMLAGKAELEFSKNNLKEAEQLYVSLLNRYYLLNSLPEKLVDATAIENAIKAGASALLLVHCLNRLTQITTKNAALMPDIWRTNAYKYIEASKLIDADNPDTAWLQANIVSASDSEPKDKTSANINKNNMLEHSANASRLSILDALDLINPIVNDWQNYKLKSTCGIDLEKHILLQADLLYAMEDFQAAAQIYHYALKVNNYSAEACFGIAMCFKVSEMWNDAKEMLAWAVEYKHDFELAKHELEAINNMNIS